MAKYNIHVQHECRAGHHTCTITGEWDEVKSRHMVSLLGLGSNHTFLDIGSNIGWFTLLSAHAGHRVIAVEPMEANLVFRSCVYLFVHTGNHPS